MAETKAEGSTVSTLLKAILPVLVGGAIALSGTWINFRSQSQSAAQGKRYDILREFVSVSMRANLIMLESAQIRMALKRASPSMDGKILSMYQDFAKERQKWALEQGVAAILAGSIFPIKVPENPEFHLAIIDPVAFERSDEERKKVAQMIWTDLGNWNDGMVPFFKDVRRFAQDATPKDYLKD